MWAQPDRSQVIFKAMGDELHRNADSLYIQGWAKPFYIQYALQEGSLFQIQATLGALTGVIEFPVSSMSAQILAGTYQLANINLANTDYRAGSRGDMAPLDGDYGEIRRRLWLLTDNAYKAAIEEYSNKTTSIKQLNLPPDVLELPDFLELPAVNYSGAHKTATYNKGLWEKIARECSAVFKKYTGIYASNVGVEIYSGYIYSMTSEGTKLRHPVNLAVLAVNAYTKLEDGEEISDRLTYYGLSETDLPPLGAMLQEIDAMAAHMVALSQAPKMEESYTGPVLIEGSALASEMVSGLLAARTGLVAYRIPLRSGGIQRLMEDRLNRRILPSDITVKSMPHLKTYNGQNLIGSYEVDAEGVTPADELVLVKNGMLQTLLCDRVPTRKIKTPTGNRVYTYQTQGISTRVSPGVLSISTSNGLTHDELENKLLDAAKAEGLEYAYIIRCLPNGRSASLYKIPVSGNGEELVRAGIVAGIGMSHLKRALGTSSETKVTSMVAGGVPLSVICPAAMILEEVDIEKENLQNTTKLPTVDNPLKK
jgi:hypothetical protein